MLLVSIASNIHTISCLMFGISNVVLRASLQENNRFHRGTVFAMLPWLAYCSEIGLALEVFDDDLLFPKARRTISMRFWWRSGPMLLCAFWGELSVLPRLKSILKICARGIRVVVTLLKIAFWVALATQDLKSDSANTQVDACNV